MNSLDGRHKKHVCTEIRISERCISSENPLLIQPRGVRSSDLAHEGSREKSPYKATTCFSAFTAPSYIISSLTWPITL
jgi:hypothetical protein